MLIKKIYILISLDFLKGILASYRSTGSHLHLRKKTFRSQQVGGAL